MHYSRCYGSHVQPFSTNNIRINLTGMKYENPQDGTTVFSGPLCRQNISWNSKLRGAHVAIFRDSTKVQHYSLRVFRAA